MTQKIIGIGNAIVDILCKVDDEFLAQNNFKKGSMSLIDEEMADKLSKLKHEKITSGGSTANTIATLSEMGIETSFIGKVGDDEFGEKFISEIEKTGTKFIGKKAEGKATAKSFILVTPDAQRTMCTFLGCASQIEESDVQESDFEDAGIFYIEGYLWDGGQTTDILKKTIAKAKKKNTEIAFTLSDGFCVDMHKKDFKHLIINDLDIVFANEDEALKLASWPTFSAKEIKKIFSQNGHLIAAVTRSEKGCVLLNGKNNISIKTDKVNNLLDTTGAGDAFAAGFLCGLINHYDLEKSAHLGNSLAGQIIQQFGARFENKLDLNRWYDAN